MEALRSSIFSSGVMASSSPASSWLLKEEWRDGKEDKDADGEQKRPLCLKVRSAKSKGAQHDHHSSRGSFKLKIWITRPIK